MQCIEQEVRVQLHLQQPELRIRKLFLQLCCLEFFFAHAPAVFVQRSAQQNGNVIFQGAIEEYDDEGLPTLEVSPICRLAQRWPQIAVHQSDEDVEDRSQYQVEDCVRRDRLRVVPFPRADRAHDREYDWNEERPEHEKG